MPALIGITCNVDEKDAKVRRAYVDAVVAAGGVPVLLAPPGSDEARIAAALLGRIDGVLFTGGDDPRTEAYGEPTHPAAVCVAAERQRFEEALYRALDDRREVPVLGVCLGMQMMALHAGGTLNQHLPDNTPTHADHANNHVHVVKPEAAGGDPGALRLPREGVGVASWHHQGVRSPGRTRVVARAHDGVIEAIDDPGREFYLGVQWHPERTADPHAGAGVIRALVAAAERGGGVPW